MMQVRDSNRFGPLRELELARFEKQIGVTLPDDYRAFLLDHNGGKPDPFHFVFADGSNGSALHHNYGLHAGPAHFRLDIANQVLSDRIPGGLIAIADDPFGNAICVGTSGNWRGRVYFWDHEANPEISLTFLAESYRAFLNSLDKGIDPDETELSRVIREDDAGGLGRLLDAGLSIEAEDEYGRTPIERVAIRNGLRSIRLLLARGAVLRNALQLAKRNAEFFPGHQQAVVLLESATTQQGDAGDRQGGT